MDSIHLLLIGTIVGMLVVLWSGGSTRWMMTGIPLNTERQERGCSGTLIGIVMVAGVLGWLLIQSRF